jgi:uncharacterized protein (DUF302 family)
MNELETQRSGFDYIETVRRIESELHRRHITIYARFDHHANAESVGLEMPPTMVVVFGSPTGGTPVMQQEAEIALDLPLRILIRQSPDGVVVQYRDPVQLVEQFGLPPEAATPFHVITDIVSTAL